MEGASGVKAEHPPVEARMENLVSADSKKPLISLMPLRLLWRRRRGGMMRRGHVSKPGDQCRELRETSENENKQDLKGEMGGSRLFGQRKKIIYSQPWAEERHNPH
jgi:hypothetical protein